MILPVTLLQRSTRGNIWTGVFDSARRQVAYQDPLSFVVTNTFDADGRNTVIQDQAGGLISMTYDARSSMASIQNQVGFITTYTYNALLQRFTRQFPDGNVTTYSYDALRRLGVTAYADGTLVTLEYDGTSNLVIMSDTTGLTTYSYDPLDRLTGKTDPGFVQAITYDVAGQRSAQADSAGGLITFLYDPNGRLTVLQASDGKTTTLAYDGADRVTTYLYASGFLRKTTFDSVGEILYVSETSSASQIGLWSFTYDGAGNRSTAQDLAGNVSSFTTDPKNRLVLAQTTGPTASYYTYTYDSRDNRLDNWETGTNAIFTYDAASRLLTFGSIQFAYDDNGNMTSVNGDGLLTTMQYDQENRMQVNMFG